jgi:hypothetical protein
LTFVLSGCVAEPPVSFSDFVPLVVVVELEVVADEPGAIVGPVVL